MTKLYENEMDQAQLVLAAKAVIDDLQNIAEKLAKMEADGILPLLDKIRLQFGQDIATDLGTTASENLNSAFEAVKSSKESIGQVITRMESMVTGETAPNDMATDTGVESKESGDTETATAAPDTEAASEEDIDAVFGDSDEPVGRATKESIERNTKALRESTNPDAVLVRDLVNRVKGGKPVHTALKETAQSYGVDFEDVFHIAKEHFKK